MTRGLFFGSTTGSQSHSKYLVEFRAGKMTLNGKMVHPDKRKGTVYLHQSEDSLMHFCWKDRTSGTLEDDLIIFPDDAEFKRVTQCTTGRVYVLKFKSSSRRCFYWMQEPKEDKDEELVRKVNEYLNNPPVPGSSRAGGGGGAGGGGSGGHLHSELSNIGDDDLQNLLNNMSQNQLVQLLGGIGGMSGVANLSSLLGGVRSASQRFVAHFFLTFLFVYFICCLLLPLPVSEPNVINWRRGRRWLGWQRSGCLGQHCHHHRDVSHQFGSSPEHQFCGRCPRSRIRVHQGGHTQLRPPLAAAQPPRRLRPPRRLAAAVGSGKHHPRGGLQLSDLQNILSASRWRRGRRWLGWQRSGCLGQHCHHHRDVSHQFGSSPEHQLCAAAPAAASESTKAATPAAATTGGSTTTPSAAATTAAGGSGGSGSTTPGAAIQLSDLQNILSGIKMPAEQAGAEAGKEASVNGNANKIAITVEQRVESLLPPPASESGSRPDSSPSSSLFHPSFLPTQTENAWQQRQALSMFSTALQSGQLGPLMQQFGMEENVVAAAASGDMGAFVKALQASKKAGEQGSPKKKKEDSGDEDMGVD
ncbi:hypothetical protein HPB48_019112 [Haemaphysalis longicornis]|uniref:Proteasomal ubiquitin receptor ADRM1 homolog n=1 Tax=Haemaphysalis longicornis TaxID=44386 RepID=A0A9J6GCQ0_HAELO|nr:hypothetical protein HPB48_019112 [Haemaphysalis longicornis]